MRSFYILRHGESEANVNRVFAAKKIDPPLTERGIKQATMQATMLKQSNLSAIYASPLLRARQTAEIINKYHGLDILVSDDLYEIDVGIFDGEDQTDPDKWALYTSIMDKWGQNLTDVAFPNGESLDDVQKRLKSFFDSLKNDTNESVLIVGHCLLFMAFTWLFCDNHNEKLDDNYMGRGCLSAINFDKNRFLIEKFNISPGV
jgi:broad specificity phosphatase PhoE